jgi:hypothetical protein
MPAAIASVSIVNENCVTERSTTSSIVRMAAIGKSGFNPHTACLTASACACTRGPLTT